MIMTRLSCSETSAHRSRGRHMSIALAAIAMAGAVGCAAQANQPGNEEAQSPDSPVGVVQAAVLNGALIGGDDYNAIVRLWSVNTKFSELRQFCTGVLLRNNVVLTAAHCLRTTQAEINNGFPDIHANVGAVIVSTDRAAFAARGIGGPAFAPDGRDLGAFKLAANLPVKSFGQTINSGFFHQLAGTPPAGQWLAVVGYGSTTGDLTSTICNYVSLNSGTRIKGCFSDPLQLNFNLGQPLLNGNQLVTLGVTSTPGDSGGPTFALVNNGGGDADLPLIGINSLASMCVPLSSSNCGAVSVRLDDLHTWLAILQ
jgi:hypothetical protein